jgi:hypothetical protein
VARSAINWPQGLGLLLCLGERPRELQVFVSIKGERGGAAYLLSFERSDQGNKRRRAAGGGEGG